ncbi:glutathione-dependent formaldehyde-activating enzyme [Diaporthe helianthi]|uniref:Glutathione-dependent formaldehyde-activating enzyme n=1 Tax=Diaporthe helianthi TaxID=158607 RepID=A0A2P5I4E8_DIAHE|nr:glutathione-dependent formaldehyde-activating enzyme [Diaporthe helianthi]
MSSDGHLKTYRGNCHCGAFVYEAKLPEITSYTECNCSICRKKGYAYLIPTQLDIIKGSIDDLATYTFNKGGYVHRFCPNCGTALLASSPQRTIINARALQNLDLLSLNVKPFDGKAFGPPYEPAVYKGPALAVGEGGKIYHGSCHCGRVTLAVRVDKPLELRDITVDEERICVCNCSACSRGAYIWIYPRIEDTVIDGEENLEYLLFNTNVTRKGFCRHCGVHICNAPSPLTDADEEALKDSVRGLRERTKTVRPITLRVLDDFDFKTVGTQKLDGWNFIKPLYVNP